ncbi:MAG: hypothetical protein K5637_00025 [Lachnospiraceae bacterium]|nr:hypothetical protein [Lachnospiraceae bacterium]
MPSASKDAPGMAPAGAGKPARKTLKDTRLKVIILAVVILLATVSIPFVSSLKYTLQFRDFEEHLTAAIADGNANRTIMITTSDAKWIPDKDTISSFNVLIHSTRMGRVVKSSDIPEDSEKMEFEFGSGKYMNVYSVQIEDKNRNNHKGVIIEYWEENYGPYIYENSVLIYQNFEALLENSEHSKRFDLP